MLRIVNAVNPFLRCRGLSLAQQQCGPRQTVEEKLGLPEKPKRPLSAFVRYLAKTRPSIIAKNPGLKSTDVFKIGSEMWKSANDATRNVFIEEAKQDYERYALQVEKYNESLTPQQKADIKEAVFELKEEVGKKGARLAHNKRNKELGKPTKPQSSFLMFSQAEKNNRGKVSIVEFQAEMAKKWNCLPPDVKEKYDLEAKKAKQVYLKELEAWEKKMMKQGNLDVVRQKILDEALPKKEKKILDEALPKKKKENK